MTKQICIDIGDLMYTTFESGDAHTMWLIVSVSCISEKTYYDCLFTTTGKSHRFSLNYIRANVSLGNFKHVKCSYDN